MQRPGPGRACCVPGSESRPEGTLEPGRWRAGRTGTCESCSAGQDLDFSLSEGHGTPGKVGGVGCGWHWICSAEEL